MTGEEVNSYNLKAIRQIGVQVMTGRLISW